MAIPRTGFGGGQGYALIQSKKRQNRQNPYAGIKVPSIPKGPFWGTNPGAGVWGSPTTPPVVGGGGGDGGYSELIRNLMNQQMADIRGESLADAASRDAALRRLFVSYGEVPDFGSLGISDQARGFLGGALDDATRNLALKNTAEGTSVKARMDEANKLALRRIPAQLASRGLLRSGQTGEDLGQQAMAHKRGMFDTLNELLGNAEGVISNFVANERARQRALAEAQMQAAMAAFENWGGYLTDNQQPSSTQTAPRSTPAFTPPPRKHPRFVYAGKPRRVNPFIVVK